MEAPLYDSHGLKDILDENAMWIFSPSGWVLHVLYTPVCLSGAKIAVLVEYA